MQAAKAVRLSLVCHAPTSSRPPAAFPADEAILRDAEPALLRLGRGLGPLAALAACGPELRCRQTAEAMGLAATIEPALAEIDFGEWRGRKLSAIEAEDPAGLAAWIRDPSCAPHGGESILDLLARVSAWLDRTSGSGHHGAVSHHSAIRAAVIHALGAPPQAFWRIDVAPASLTELSFDGRRWMLRALSRMA